MFGLERDQQAGDTNERGTTTFRVLKDRYTGRSTGATFPLRYDQKTGRLHEATVADDFEENEDALEDPDF
jgi:twinkle protein